MKETEERAPESVHRLLEELGLSLHGFCPYEQVKDRLLPCRAAARLPDGAKSVILCLFPYRFPEKGERNLSRYACVPDYHTVVGRRLEEATDRLGRLFPGEAFALFVDNSPIPEVQAAALAGLGVVGDNGLLIHPEFGSWVFIGEIVTTLPLLTTGPAIPGRCLGCGACARHCPAACIPAGDKTTCLSAVSQKKGLLTPEEEALLEEEPLVWGCDRCQEICPMNQTSRCDPDPCFDAYTPLLTEESVTDWKGKPWGWRGPAVPRRNLALQTRKTKKEG